MYRVLLLLTPTTVHKQKDYNLKGNYIDIVHRSFGPVTDFYLFLLRAKHWICVCTVSMYSHNQINLFMAEISQFNLHFNAFAHYFAGTKTVYMAFVSKLLLFLIFTDLCSFFCAWMCAWILCVQQRASSFVISCMSVNDGVSSIRQQQQQHNQNRFISYAHYHIKRVWIMAYTNKAETNDFLFLLSDFFIVSICCSDTNLNKIPNQH